MTTGRGAPPTRRRPLGVSLALGLLLTVACSEGARPARARPKVPAMQYAVSVCAELRSWADDLAAEVTALSKRTGAASDDDVPARNAAIVEAARRTRRRTAELAGRLDELGRPDVRRGERFPGELRAAVAEAETVLEEAEQAALAIPPDDRQTWVYRGAELAVQVEKAFRRVGLRYDLLVREYAATAMWDGFTRDACRDYGSPVQT